MSDEPEAYDRDGRRLSIEELRREIALGLDELDQGLVDSWDPDDLKRRIRERIRRQKGE
jgi:hypothetical protein